MHFFWLSIPSFDYDRMWMLLQRITEKQNNVVITDRMWARLLSSTNQPSFLGPKDIPEEKKEMPEKPTLDGENCDGVVDIPPVTKEITK